MKSVLKPWPQQYVMILTGVIFAVLTVLAGSLSLLSSHASPTPTYSAQLVNQDPTTIGKAVYPVTTAWLDFKNTGTTAWTKNNITLVSTDSAGSPFAVLSAPPGSPNTPLWPNNRTVFTFSGQLNGVTLDTSAQTINPGQVARFFVDLDARNVPLGAYTENFGLQATAGAVSGGGTLSVTVANTINQLRGANMHPFQYLVEYNPPNGGFESRAQYDQELNLLQQAGANVVRVDFYWIIFDGTTPGTYNLSYLNDLGTFIQDAHARGINVETILLGTPCWASSAPSNITAGCTPGGSYEWYPPTNMNDYANVASYIANYFQSPRIWGANDAIEIWNEPNLCQFYQTANDPACNNGAASGTPTDEANASASYAAMLKAAYHPNFLATFAILNH